MPKSKDIKFSFLSRDSLLSPQGEKSTDDSIFSMRRAISILQFSHVSLDSAVFVGIEPIPSIDLKRLNIISTCQRRRYIDIISSLEKSSFNET